MMEQTQTVQSITAIFKGRTVTTVMWFLKGTAIKYRSTRLGLNQLSVFTRLTIIPVITTETAVHRSKQISVSLDAKVVQNNYKTPVRLLI